MSASTPDVPGSGEDWGAHAPRVPTLPHTMLFFCIAFALTWVLFLPLILGAVGLRSSEGSLLMLGIAAPTVTAFVLTGLFAGRDGVRRLFRSGLRWRVGIGWYAFVLVGPGLVLGVSLMVAALAGEPRLSQAISVEVVIAAVISGLLAGIFEEFGWSGFAFPGLQSRYGLLRAGIAMGIAVALWHIPFFFVPGTTQSTSNFGFFMVQLIPARILFGWIVNGTGRSVLLPILFHGSWNAWHETFETGPMVADTFGLSETVLLALAAATVLLVRPRRVHQPPAPLVSPTEPAV